MIDDSSRNPDYHEQYARRRKQSVVRGLACLTPIIVESASGALVRDVNGREYIDFAGGIGVLNVGHSHPRVVRAIQEQAARFTHTCYPLLGYEDYLQLVEKLAELMPGSFAKKGILFNSGAEAVENAVKIARHSTGRPGILCFDHAFHGRTLLALSMTSKEVPYKKGFFAALPHIHRASYAYCWRCPVNKSYPGCDIACLDESLDRLFHREGLKAEEVAAVVVEPILGEGGFVPPPPEFLQRLQDWCRRNGSVFIADEIQTGFGRTGKMFAVEHFGVVPDLIILAKSIGGGVPLSAIIGRAEIMDSPGEGGVGSTYGGNPIACAAALAVLDIFQEENLVERANRIGNIFRTELAALQKRFPRIGDVRGVGAMIAIELVQDLSTREPDTQGVKAVLEAACRRGLILLKSGTYSNVIRFLPPLNIPEDQLRRGLKILGDSLTEIYG